MEIYNIEKIGVFDIINRPVVDTPTNGNAIAYI